MHEIIALVTDEIVNLVSMLNQERNSPKYGTDASDEKISDLTHKITVLRKIRLELEELL